MPRCLIRALETFNVLAVSVLLNGCISTQGIQPHTDLLPTAELAIDLANRDAHWPVTQWWRAYGDPQLDTWIARASRGSPSLQAATARVREAQAMAGVAQSREAAQLTSGGRLARRGWPEDGFYGPGNLADSHTWDNNAGLNLSLDLDLWGRERNASERALDIAQQRAAEQRQAQLQLQGNVIHAYIQLALQYAQLEILEATLAQQVQIAELARQRLQAGIGTQLEVSQAEALLPETHRQIDGVHEAIELSRHQLAALAGLGPEHAASLKRPLLTLHQPLPLPTAVPAQLLGQRPDVVASRWQVAAQARGIAVAQAGFYPNVDLTASLGYMATGGGMLEFLTASKLAYNAGPAISLPIFDGGRLRGELGQASAAYDLAVAHYRQTLVSALQGIADQLVRRHSLEQQQRLAAESVAKANELCALARLAWQRGLVDYLSVLHSQTRLWRLQGIEQQVEAARLSAYADLSIALGGGLQAGQDSPAEPQLKAPQIPAGLATNHN
ncbi:efflux transporter outer membrane subunit [Pseudomonas sp. LJDD11]|uniref:efflux transporter outer membrane subunit n=1 Tax=Pseudomonas sp. LJDD11 TaxID=2931984 RepID=UPI00211BC461|nr:efflux transporter outer membrane subunit [Pseudomonas sp. LJDD11]MCQ9426374.1 efflux transporter outer membrane subunit [Pseudomonas sp. LJDD11]